MSIQSLAHRLTPVRDWLTFSQVPGDSKSTRDLKVIATVVLCLFSLSSMGYISQPDHAPFEKGVSTTFLCIDFFAIAILWISKSPWTTFSFFAPLCFGMITFLMFIYGTREGDFIALLFLSLAAMFVQGPQRSWWWIAASVTVLACLPLFDANLPRLILNSAVFEANPEGLVFHAPWKTARTFQDSIGLALKVGTSYLTFRFLYMRLRDAREAVEIEKTKVDRLMAAVFPSTIAAKLKENNEEVIATHHPNATILFADIVEFTPLAANLTPADAVDHLDRIFAYIDELAAVHGVEKIKTIGDAYMAATGLPEPMPDHLERMARFAIALRDGVSEISQSNLAPVALRIGLHSGPVVAGVIGRTKPFYDVWGDSVNIAARLERHGVSGHIQMLKSTAENLKTRFDFSDPHSIDLKGVGLVQAVYLENIKT